MTSKKATPIVLNRTLLCRRPATGLRFITKPFCSLRRKQGLGEQNRFQNIAVNVDVYVYNICKKNRSLVMTVAIYTRKLFAPFPRLKHLYCLLLCFPRATLNTCSTCNSSRLHLAAISRHCLTHHTKIMHL